MGFTLQQKVTFIILWLAYGSTYLLRKPFGFMKKHIKVDYNLEESSLGYIDFAFLCPYAIGSLFMAGFVDRMGPRRVLLVTLLGSAAATFCLYFAQNYSTYLFFLALSGTFQSTAWPAACSLLTSWFPDTSKTILFSWFGTTCFVWSLLGSLLPVIIEVIFKDFKFLKSVYIFASLGVVMAVIMILCCVRTSPKPAAYTSLAKQSSRSAVSCLSLPIVKEVALTMFFIKGVRYAFMFWLPYYLIESLGYTAVAGGLTAIAFDIGGIFGSVLIGVVAEKFLHGNEVLASIYSLCGSIVAIVCFFAFQIDGNLGWALNIVWLTLIGVLNCGPDIIFTGSMAAKLGELHGCPSAVTGAINGLGSLGTVTEGPLVALASSYFGLSSISIFVGGFSLIAVFFSLKAHRLLEQEKRALMVPEF